MWNFSGYCSKQIPAEVQFTSGGVFEHYMIHAMDTLENKYGSVHGYLADELGLTGTDIDRLRERYTV